MQGVSLNFRRLVGLLIIFMLSSAPLGALESEHQIVLPDNPEVLASVDIFAIDENIKATLDRTLGQLDTTMQIAKGLHMLLFDERYLGIAYDFDATRTAQDAFDLRSGNCISLAILYVASARYLGLEAQLQSVEIPLEWLLLDDIYMVPQHINVAVTLQNRKRKLIVEFADIFSARDTRAQKSTLITDQQVRAEFYNNIGISHLQRNDPARAKAFLLESIATFAKVDFVWSNLGVVERQLGNLGEAERAYRQGLKLNRRNLSALTNLYFLYLQTNRTKEAQKLALKVERYSQKNPYHLMRIAKRNAAEGNLKSAIRFLNRAIRIKDDEPQFLLELAALHYTQGEFERSIELIELARTLSTDEQDQARYQAKLDHVRQSLL